MSVNNASSGHRHTRPSAASPAKKFVSGNLPDWFGPFNAWDPNARQEGPESARLTLNFSPATHVCLQPDCPLLPVRHSPPQEAASQGRANFCAFALPGFQRSASIDKIRAAGGLSRREAVDSGQWTVDSGQFSVSHTLSSAVNGQISVARSQPI